MTAVTQQATSDLSNTGGFTTSPLFSKINDSSDSTLIVGVTQAGGRVTFGFTAFNLPSNAIVSSVDIHYRHRSTTTGNGYAHGACIKVGANYYGRGQAGGTTYWDAGHATGVASSGAIEDHLYVGTLNPATGAAWLYDAVNALTEFGVCSDDFNPDANFYQIDITVNYTLQTTVTPGTATEATAKYVPLVNKNLIPPINALALTKYTPLWARGVVPSIVALAMTALAPLLTRSIVPVTSSSTTTTYTSVVKLDLIPATLANSLTTYVPTVQVGAGDATVIPDTASIATSAFVPKLTVGLVPGVSSLVTSLLSSAISIAVVPTTLELQASSATPSLCIYLVPEAAALTTGGVVVTVELGVIPSLLAITSVSYSPDVVAIVPSSAGLVLSLFIPEVLVSEETTVIPDTVSLALYNYVADILVSYAAIVTPDVLNLILSALVPKAGRLLTAPASRKAAAYDKVAGDLWY